MKKDFQGSQMFLSYTQSSFCRVSSKGVMSMPLSTSTWVACSSISGSRCCSLAKIQANSSLIAPKGNPCKSRQQSSCGSQSPRSSRSPQGFQGTGQEALQDVRDRGHKPSQGLCPGFRLTSLPRSALTHGPACRHKLQAGQDRGTVHKLLSHTVC